MQLGFQSPTLSGVSRFLFWPVLILALAGCALEAGIWKNTEVHRGPFVSDPFAAPGFAGRVVNVALDQRYTCCTEVRSDRQVGQSDLRLWINDREMGPPATLHAAIRNGESTGFSHWDGQVIFSLPPGVANSPATKVTVVYSRRLKRGVTISLALATILLGWIGYGRRVMAARAAMSFGQRAAITRIPSLMLQALGAGAFAAALLYFAASLYALFAGWQLPTTAPIRWWPVAAWVAQHEPFAGQALLAVAIVGAAAAWACRWLVGTPGVDTATPRQEGRSAEPCAMAAWPLFAIVAGLLILDVSAMWSGMTRPGDLHGSSIGGLLQFADASGYLAGAYDQARDGVWNEFAARRPMAAAFRSVLLFFASDATPTMLLLQSVLLAGAITFATVSVARWRGEWAALVFLGLTYTYVSAFTPTTLTEALGLFWALVSMPFLITALRSQSRAHALLGLAFTTIALMTRMGNMFTIPALILWIAWVFGQSARERVRIFAIAAAVVVGVGAFNATLQKLYGSPQATTGSNFSYVLCGLTIGKTWVGCLDELEARGESVPQSEEARDARMYAMARENFKKQPGVFFSRLADGAAEFVNQVPDLLWRGYLLQIREPYRTPRGALAIVCLAGVAYVLLRRRERGEILFWLLMLTSIVVSSALVFHDDGRRVMAVSIPWLCLFFALGATGPLSPSARIGHAPARVRAGLALLGIAALLFLVIPALAHSLSSVAKSGGGSIARASDEMLVMGGRRMSGFLVVADDADLRAEFASLHISDLARILAVTGIEQNYQGIIHPERPPLPFGLIYAPRIDASSYYQFIVPPGVLERPDVPAWRFKVKPWQVKPEPGSSSYFLYVTRAEPVEGTGPAITWD